MPEIIRFGNALQPNSVEKLSYRSKVADDLKITLRDNVRALLGLQPGESGVSRLIDLGIPNGNAQRVLGGTTSIGLDSLADLATALSVQPWQLCVPGLDPERLPVLVEPTFRWPFRRIDPEVVTNLVGTAAHNVENGLLSALATAGVSPRKQASTGT